MSKVEKAKKYLEPYNEINENTAKDALKILLDTVESQDYEDHIKYIVTLPALVVNEIIIPSEEIQLEYKKLSEELEILKSELMEASLKEHDIYSESYNFGEKCKDLRIKLTIFVNDVLFNFFSHIKMGASEFYDHYEQNAPKTAIGTEDPDKF